MILAAHPSTSLLDASAFGFILTRRADENTTGASVLSLSSTKSLTQLWSAQNFHWLYHWCYHGWAARYSSQEAHEAQQASCNATDPGVDRYIAASSGARYFWQMNAFVPEKRWSATTSTFHFLFCGLILIWSLAQNPPVWIYFLCLLVKTMGLNTYRVRWSLSSTARNHNF